MRLLKIFWNSGEKYWKVLKREIGSITYAEKLKVSKSK